MPQSAVLSQYLPAFSSVLVQQHLSAAPARLSADSGEIGVPTADTPLKYLRLQLNSGSVELERPPQ